MVPRILAAVSILFLAACARTPAVVESPEPSPSPAADSPALEPAPWQRDRLSGASLPAAYVTQWSKAANRATCALIAPSSLGNGIGATARAATFSGGWAVAYDMPSMRSAFGVAGSGSLASDPSYDWPYRMQFADGSSAGYGPEGGTGPNELAYLRIAGQTCLYNVWSRLGRSHLEMLLRSMRFVQP